MNTPHIPEIHAVVEVAIDGDCPWIQFPAKPLPRYVRLWRETEHAAVALVVGTLSSYGGRNVALSAEALLNHFPRVLPGGFAVVAQEKFIGPSCCCGLEQWKEWLDVLATGNSPWMGHDPAPFVEVLEDQVNVWTDGGLGELGERSKGESPVVFSRQEFEQAVRTAARDLSEFEQSLRSWAQRSRKEIRQENRGAVSREVHLVTAEAQATVCAAQIPGSQ